MTTSTSQEPYIDVLIVDWHSYRSKILDGQTRMPLSTQAMDIWGDDRDEITQLGLSQGDPDGFCVPVASGFHAQPWNPGNEQILCTLHKADNSPSDFDVRAQLQTRIQALAEIRH